MTVRDDSKKPPQSGRTHFVGDSLFPHFGVNVPMPKDTATRAAPAVNSATPKPKTGQTSDKKPSR